MSNKFYFDYSLKNKDDNLKDIISNIKNFNLEKDHVVINQNSLMPKTDLMIENQKLIDLITAYKVLNENREINLESIYYVIDEIINIIEKAKLINYSSFCSYMQVIGYSYNSYKCEKDFLSKQNKEDLFKAILDSYIKNRHNMYLYHGYSNQVLQNNSDIASSRRKGIVGIEKMQEIVSSFNIKRANSKIEFANEDKSYLLPDKGNKKDFNDILLNYSICFKFKDMHQNKYPDMLLKIRDHYFIIEHKLTCGGGGSQNEEINEIIDFVAFNERSNKWHYVSCLQGDYFKKLSDSKEEKVKKQINNIEINLNKNPNNFFVNGLGLKKLINDYCSNENNNENNEN